VSRTIIFVAPHFPNIVSSFLAKKGYEVIEACSTEVVEQLASGRTIDAVILASDSLHSLVTEDRDGRMNVNFSVHASSRELYLELTGLFPQSAVPIIH
jgi:hypothetical protein